MKKLYEYVKSELNRLEDEQEKKDRNVDLGNIDVKEKQSYWERSGAISSLKGIKIRIEKNDFD